MAVDLISLPVWPFRPNWSEGITERLEWLTDVMTSGSGSEQRRSARLTPRRMFEFTVNPAHRERTALDLFLHRMAVQEMLLPIWHDQARLAADLTTGTADVQFDNTFREHLVGQCLIVYQDTFNYEVFEIDAMTDNGVTAGANATRTWLAGTAVYPVRPARLTADSSFSALTGRVGEAQVLLTLSRENDHAALQTLADLFAGTPILYPPPNRIDPLDLDYQRMLKVFDNQTGRPYARDVAGRSFTTQIHNWTCYGREQQQNLRKLLYWLRGRARALWIPTFNDDVRVARDALLGADRLDIDNIGYAYTGGSVEGRNLVLFRLDGGPEVVSIADVEAGLASDEERLVLAATLDQDVGEGAYGSFMEIGRLDQDSIEITHHTDSEGVCEISAAFRSFRDQRDETEALIHDTPAASQNSSPCGAPLVSFNGLSWLLPCLSSSSASICNTYASRSDSYNVGGDSAVVYDVTLRVRGVVEMVSYSGGSNYGSTGFVQQDATGHSPSAYNVYRLEVSDPPASYYLNKGVTSSSALTALDYELTIPIRGGATITLAADAVDNKEVKNQTNATVLDDDPSAPVIVPQPYNGQFMQIDGELPV